MTYVVVHSVALDTDFIRDAFVVDEDEFYKLDTILHFDHLDMVDGLCDREEITFDTREEAQAFCDAYNAFTINPVWYGTWDGRTAQAPSPLASERDCRAFDSPEGLDYWLKNPFEYWDWED